MKTIEKILDFIFRFIFSVIFPVILSVLELFTSYNLKRKAVIVSVYAVLILLAVFMPVVFFILIILYLLVALVFSIKLVDIISDFNSCRENKAKTESKDGEKTYERKKEDIPYARDKKGAFFEGMTLDEAKKEYKRLMKIYHPDNTDSGDPEVSKRISAAYNDYRKRVRS